MNIFEFIDENIIVDRFPVSKEIREGNHKDCKVIINVSDEFYLGNSEEIIKEGKLNYYFPMGEVSADIGLVSMYGALKVLYEIYTWNPEWKVLLHCSAGLNRSPTVKYAFYYMMLGEHSVMGSRLKYNCEKGHLPELQTMELFLTKCKEAFDNPQDFLGGVYDWVLRKSNINKPKQNESI